MVKFWKFQILRNHRARAREKKIEDAKPPQPRDSRYLLSLSLYFFLFLFPERPPPITIRWAMNKCIILPRSGKSLPWRRFPRNRTYHTTSNKQTIALVWGVNIWRISRYYVTKSARYDLSVTFTMGRLHSYTEERIICFISPIYRVASNQMVGWKGQIIVIGGRLFILTFINLTIQRVGKILHSGAVLGDRHPKCSNFGENSNFPFLC